MKTLLGKVDAALFGAALRSRRRMMMLMMMKLAVVLLLVDGMRRPFIRERTGRVVVELVVELWMTVC